MSFLQKLYDLDLISRKESERLAKVKRSDEPLYLTAVRMGVMSDDDYLRAASEFFDLDVTGALSENYSPEPFATLPVPFLDENLVFPVRQDAEAVVFAVHDPLAVRVRDVLARLYPQHELRLVLAREELIRSWIRRYFGADEAVPEETVEDVGLTADVEGLKDLASEAPVIKTVNQMLTRAVEIGASDIHVEPFLDRVQVRFRADGLLYEHEVLPKRMLQGLTTRVKIMAQMDIAERRLPQDGRIQIKVAGKNIDLRVSCLPVMYGESIVLRILDKQSISFSLGSLGFPDRELSRFNSLIRQPYGIILVTGPTGSGKTTTLYSALHDINSPDKKIITVEDPVEYELDGINQVQVNTTAGLTFARGLRSIVRQDPDVILIGEIRDQETADIAIQSALTGHLVFSTLHTNNAAGAVARLLEMGAEDYLLASSIIGIMAQRLVRVLCPHCKEAYTMPDGVRQRFGLDGGEIFRPKGCAHCGQTGYRGRVAIFELLEIDDEIRELMLLRKSASALTAAGVAKGMRLLRDDGLAKVRDGVTSLDEVIRVAGGGGLEGVG